MQIDNNILDSLFQKKLMNLEIEALKNKMAQLEKKLSEVCGATSDNEKGVETEEKKDILNNYQKKFLEYKAAMYAKGQINLNRISLPFVKEKVSVILPVYNGDDYITFSIKSVLEQTYKNFELIIIDDGSNDNTPEIVDQYAKCDNRIQVIHQENRKLPKTLSRGFQMAKGEYLTWTSADNVMHPTFLERFVDNMKRYPDVDMFFGNMQLIDEKGDFIEDGRWFPEKDHPENVILPRNMLELNTYPNNYVGAAFMYRYGVAQIIENYASNRYGIEDYDYWMKVNDLFAIRHVDFSEPLYSYRFHSKSLTSKDKELKITENRYLTMSWDNTRRDYFLKPTVWVLGECDQDMLLYREKLIKQIYRSGNIIKPVEEVLALGGEHFYNLITVDFENHFVVEKKKLPQNTFKVLIQQKPGDIKDKNNFNCYICITSVVDENRISDYRGWFGIESADEAVAVIDAKSKIEKLTDMENVMSDDLTLNLSLIILSNGDEDNLCECLENVFQSKGTRDEVIVVCNSVKAKQIQQIISRYHGCRLLQGISENETDMINLGIWNSKGKYISILAEDCLVEKGYCKNINNMFEAADKLGAICGTVKYSNVKKKELFRSHEFLAESSGLLMKDEEIYELGSVNISFRSKEVKDLGGLQKAVQNENMDLPDVSIQSLIQNLKKHDWYILAVDNCDVTRVYSPNILLSRKHTRLLSYYMMNKNLVIEKYTNLDYMQTLLNKKERIEFRYILNDGRRLEKYDAAVIKSYYSNPVVKKRNATKSIAVSVIVPVYNVQEYLERCVKSLLNQTFKDYEILLIDDGSEDGSGKLCDDYAARYDSIKVYHKKNGGLSDARNFGIDKAVGEYLFFVDSDDWVDNDMLRVLYQTIVRYRVDIAECSYRSIYRDYVDEETDNTNLVITGDSVFALKSEMEWKYFKSVAWNKLYNRKLFSIENLYPVGRYHEDEFTTHKLFFDSSSLAYVDCSMYNYDQTREGSITATVTPKILDSCYALRERVNYICEKNITVLESKVKDLYCWFLFDRIYKCIKANIRDKKMDELLEMLRDEYDEVMKWKISNEYKRKYTLLVGSYEMFSREMEKEKEQK